MIPDLVRVAVLVGSARAGCRSRSVAEWVCGQAGYRAELSVDLIDLATIPLSLAGPTWDPGPSDAATLAETTPRLAEADAFVVVTPEYNHSFPAVLKNFLDWHVLPWQAKPVGFVSHGGGLGGGVRAVEQLRSVFAELRAVALRDTVSFPGGALAFDEHGLPREQGGGVAALGTLLDELVWWALALREARAMRPYLGG
ncbi:NADPH-dependent FMN reductase [Crossiella sp. CA198]|uniref:NADPH-dependent FMN reductase n=1 Tax=Crossiella sp. CA198 TaxID=3455607 RepID=UPI003F8D180F